MSQSKELFDIDSELARVQIALVNAIVKLKRIGRVKEVNRLREIRAMVFKITDEL